MMTMQSTIAEQSAIEEKDDSGEGTRQLMKSVVIAGFGLSAITILLILYTLIAL